jgi:hypothetical protein
MFLVPGTFVPFREHGNNLVPVVLNPSFSSVPRTPFPFLDPIDPGTWLLRSACSFAIMCLDPFNAFFSAKLALGVIILKSLYKQDGSKCDHMEL